MAEVANNVAFEVHRHGDRVAQRGRAEQRQHQIRPRRYPPPTQGLAEIFTLPLNTHLAGRVQNTAQAHQRIHANAHKVARRGLALGLKKTVDE